MSLMRRVLQDLLWSPSAGLFLLLQRFHIFFPLQISVDKFKAPGLLLSDVYDFPLSQAISWTRTVPVWRNAPLVPMETLLPTCVRNVHPTVNPAGGTAITASAAPKAALNCTSTRGAAGPIAQSKIS